MLGPESRCLSRDRDVTFILALVTQYTGCYCGAQTMTKALFRAPPPMIPSNTTDIITTGRKYGLIKYKL